MTTNRIAALSLMLVLAGCSRSKTVTTSNGEVKVEESGKPGQSTVTITGKDGANVTFSEQGTKLPADYPKDVPVVSGAKIVMATSASSAEGNGSSLILESPDNLEKTAAFYKKALADSGWKTEATVAAEKMTMFSASKDARQLVVQVTESDGKCSVSQTLGKK